MEYGTVRDGMVFIQKNLRCRNGEYWMKMDHFLRVAGADYFERKAAFKERQYPSDEERERRKQAKKPKENEYSRAYMAQRRKDHPDLIRGYDREYRERNKSNPEYVKRRRAASARFEKKIKDANAHKKAEKQRIREEKESALAAARASRLAVMAENKAKREAAASLRPPRKILTDEQRLEAKRKDKKNQKHRRRALLRGQEAKATRSQIEALRAKAKGICRYCREKFRSLTIDHITPLCLGGTHTIDNICFACHACNSRKSGRPAHEFCKDHGMLLV